MDKLMAKPFFTQQEINCIFIAGFGDVAGRG